MQNLSKRERNMVIICAIVLVFTAIILLLPSSKSASNRPLMSRERAEQQYRLDRAKYIQLGQDQAAMLPRIQKMAYNMQPNAVVPLVARDLQLIAARAGVHLNEVRPLRPHALPSGQATEIQIEVRLHAAFQPGVVSFLYQIEDPSGHMVVDKLDINSGESRFKTVDVTAVIAVFTQALPADSNSEGDTGSDT